MIARSSFWGTICLLVLWNAGSHCFAQKIRVAVAANARAVIKQLQSDFKKRSGVEIEAISGASGNLIAQIRNGAPFDVFLSADADLPNQLFRDGFGLEKPKVYALGSLIICGYSQGNLQNWPALLGTAGIRKIAIANPATAPYGRAAEESLKFYGLYDNVKRKLVFGESIAQVNTYIETRAAALAFTTESFLYEGTNRSGLSWARIDQKTYGRMEQAVILLSHSKKSGSRNAQQFYNYLSSVAAKRILVDYGYHLPN